MSKKYMIWPTYIKLIFMFAGAFSIVIIVTLVLISGGVISGTTYEIIRLIVIACVLLAVVAIGLLLYALTFVSFSEEKIHIVSYTCFGIPIKSEYMINKINSVIIFYGYVKCMKFSCIGKNVLNLEIRDEVLKTVLKYIPHDVIKAELQCPQKVKGEQQKLIKPFLSEKQKKELHMQGYNWCDE